MANADRFSTELGARLRRARKTLGMSLLDVQKATDGQWKSVTIRNYEVGDRALKVEQFVGLARFYGLDPGLLLAEASLAAMAPRAVAA